MKTFFMAIMFVALTSSGPDAYVVTHEFEVESQKEASQMCEDIIDITILDTEDNDGFKVIDGRCFIREVEGD